MSSFYALVAFTPRALWPISCSAQSSLESTHGKSLGVKMFKYLWSSIISDHRVCKCRFSLDSVPSFLFVWMPALLILLDLLFCQSSVLFTFLYVLFTCATATGRIHNDLSMFLIYASHLFCVSADESSRGVILSWNNTKKRVECFWDRCWCIMDYMYHCPHVSALIGCRRQKKFRIDRLWKQCGFTLAQG